MDKIRLNEWNDFTKTRINESSLLTEGQFGWLTQDTEEPIPSWRPFHVYMYDNKGNSWHELKYEGYGVFDGKDYYELLAEMNGYSKEDGWDLRDTGIKIAFDEIKPKNGGKVLFPALVTTKSFDWKNHDFFDGPKNDPNQSWGDDEEDEEE